MSDRGQQKTNTPPQFQHRTVGVKARSPSPGRPPSQTDDDSHPQQKMKAPATAAKHCHECGEAFPVERAKFCCGCGEKRLGIE